ncbi:hypothetical protein OG194_18795 [Streptomyces sp. NBC_01288]|uniref:hypothetical protein n=1 Tax=Streptomyces sp. NBC_01288 TaxID=2903814 RepID=UPI002E11E1B3|nr:hypothetical protein OG194_18795 [Streptomyces sp. NBC_01288]
MTRLTRLEEGPPEARELGRQVLAALDQYVANGGDVAELLPIFGLTPEAEKEKEVDTI